MRHIKLTVNSKIEEDCKILIEEFMKIFKQTTQTITQTNNDNNNPTLGKLAANDIFGQSDIAV